MPIVQPSDAVGTLAYGVFTDVKFSPDGYRLYAVSGNSISVINAATGAVLNTYTVGARLGALDISADGAYLAVVEAQAGDTATLYRINLSTGGVATFSTAIGSMGAQGSFHDIAFLGDGNVLVSQRLIGSGSEPLRLLDFNTGQFAIPGGIMSSLGSVGPATLTASADHSHVQITTGQFPTFVTTYSYQTGVGVVAQVNTGPADPYAGAGLPNLVNRGVLAISPTENFFVEGPRLNILDSSLHLVTSIAAAFPYLSDPQGLAFSADGQRLYAVYNGTIVAFSTANWQPLGAYSAGAASASPYDSLSGTYVGFGDILQASPDGRYLSVIGTGGIQRIDLALVQFESTAGNDVISGTSPLFGFAGNDDITPVGPSAWMVGGTGDDTYHVSSPYHMVQELAGEGHDTVRSTITYALPGPVEDLVLEGSADINGFGNLLDNIIVGNLGNNRLYGDAGSDRLSGSDGDDILDGGAGDDTLDGETGNDTASYASGFSPVSVNLANAGPQNTGGAGIDTLIGIENLIGSYADDQLRGNSGANRLDGGTGADTLVGAGGDDTYVIDNAGDVVTELASEGYDRVFSTVSGVIQANVEELTVTGNGLTALGDSCDNVLNSGGGNGNSLYGLDGNDVLNGGDQAELVLGGGTGNDVINGNGGDDLIVGGAGNDQIDGGAGFDTVDYSRESGTRSVYVNLSEQDSYEPIDPANPVAIPLSAHTARDSFGNTDTLNGVEHIVGGGGNDFIHGSAATETLEGGAGNDFLTSGGGGDTLIGGSGEDTYVVSAGDIVVELGADSHDRITTALATYSIANLPNIEDLWGETNSPGQSLTGNAGNNFIQGSRGNDALSGGAGDDTLFPGAGVDTLTGGAGNDTFLASASGFNGDTITDFSIGDRIRIFDGSLNSFSMSLSADVLTYTGGSVTLQNLNLASLAVSAAPEGGVQITFSGPPLILAAGPSAAPAMVGGGASQQGGKAEIFASYNYPLVLDHSASAGSPLIPWGDGHQAFDLF